MTEKKIKKRIGNAFRCALIVIFALFMLARIIYCTQFSIAVHASIGDVVSRTANGNVMEFECDDNRKVKVELCTERTVRIQLSDGSGNYRPYDPEYYMVQTDANLMPAAPHTTTTDDVSGTVTVKTSRMEIRKNHPCASPCTTFRATSSAGTPTKICTGAATLWA